MSVGCNLFERNKRKNERLWQGWSGSGNCCIIEMCEYFCKKLQQYNCDMIVMIASSAFEPIDQNTVFLEGRAHHAKHSPCMDQSQHRSHAIQRRDSVWRLSIGWRSHLDVVQSKAIHPICSTTPKLNFIKALSKNPPSPGIVTAFNVQQIIYTRWVCAVTQSSFADRRSTNPKKNEQRQ